MKLAIQVQALDSDAVQHFELPVSGEPILLGRGPDSPVPLDGVKLSRSHLSLAVIGGQLTLTDLSSNGVWINAQSMPKKSPVALRGDEEIAIPGYRLRFRLLVPVPLTPLDGGSANLSGKPEMAADTARSSPASSVAGAAGATQVMRTAPPQDVQLQSAASSRHFETLSGETDTGMPGEAPTEIETPWWRLTGLEKTVLAAVALSCALVAYYINMQ